jgi:hypothetical protein
MLIRRSTPESNLDLTRANTRYDPKRKDAIHGCKSAIATFRLVSNLKIFPNWLRKRRLCQRKHLMDHGQNQFEADKRALMSPKAAEFSRQETRHEVNIFERYGREDGFFSSSDDTQDASENKQFVGLLLSYTFQPGHLRHMQSFASLEMI